VDRIIFLDVDGVLKPYSRNVEEWLYYQSNILNPDCCVRFKEILDTTNAKIVVSSTWRIEDKHLITLVEELRKYGIHEDTFIGVTTDLENKVKSKDHNELRWLEIKDYIDKHNITDYAILDDFDFGEYAKDRLIQTEKYIGLTEELKTRCINVLNTPIHRQTN